MFNKTPQKQRTCRGARQLGKLLYIILVLEELGQAKVTHFRMPIRRQQHCYMDDNGVDELLTRVMTPSFTHPLGCTHPFFSTPTQDHTVAGFDVQVYHLELLVEVLETLGNVKRHKPTPEQLMHVHTYIE